MKWIGQHIYDLVSRFRNDVYLEDISTGTIASGGNLGLDSNNKIVKATETVGDITGVALTAGTGVDLTSVSGATGGAYAATISVDVSDFMTNGLSSGGILTSTGADAMTANSYLTFVNDAGESDTSTLSIVSNQDVGDKFKIATTTHGATTITTLDDDAAAASLTFNVDGNIFYKTASGSSEWYKSGNDDDKFRISVGTHGATTLTTIDDAAAAAHFEVVADGNITLDPAGVIELEGDTTVTGDFIVNGDVVTFESANADDPIVTIKNTSNGTNDMASLKMVKDRADNDVSAGTNIAEIYFVGEDSAQNEQEYGRILSEIDVGTNGQESGKLKFGVANEDGGNGYGLTMQGGSVNDEIDVTVGLGAASVTTIAGTLTMGSTAAMTNAGLLSVANQSNITGVGTIGTGTWQGTAIATAYIADDAVTEDKLANTLLAEIDENTTKVSNVTTNLSQTTASDTLRINSSDGTNVTIAQASGSIAGLMTVTHHDKLDGIEASATADQSSGEILTAIEDGVDSVHYVDGSIDTAHIADDQVTFAKASGVTPNVYGNIIKLIPSDFATNDDGGNTKFGMGYTDSPGTGYGMRVPNNSSELYAFVSIPEGMKATHVDIHDKSGQNLAVEVFEAQIDATTMASRGTGNANTTIDIDDVDATATNFLAIEVTTTSTGDRIYGGSVTIAAQ